MTLCGLPEALPGARGAGDDDGPGRLLGAEADRAPRVGEDAAVEVAGGPVGDRRAPAGRRRPAAAAEGLTVSQRLRTRAIGACRVRCSCCSLPTSQPTQPGRLTTTSTETASPGVSCCFGIRRPSRTAIGIGLPSGPVAWTCSTVPPKAWASTLASASGSEPRLAPDIAKAATANPARSEDHDAGHAEQDSRSRRPRAGLGRRAGGGPGLLVHHSEDREAGSGVLVTLQLRRGSDLLGTGDTGSAPELPECPDGGRAAIRPGAVRRDRVHRRPDRPTTSRRTRPTGLRWALVGRNRAKLEAVRCPARRELAREAPAPDLLEADAADAAALAKVAESARVVITTVGPYALYGGPLVAACAAAGTDYVDLTGEPEFVDRMWVEHHAEAERTGARLVHCCGFDSIPHDLGAYFTVKQLPEGVPLTVERLRPLQRQLLRRHLPLGDQRLRPGPADARRRARSAAAPSRGPPGARSTRPGPASAATPSSAAGWCRCRRSTAPSSAAPPRRSSATAPTSPTATTWSPSIWRRSPRSAAGVGARRRAGAAAADPQAAAEDQVPGRGARARPSGRRAGSRSGSSARAAASASSPRSPAATPATARPRRCWPSRRSASPSTSCRRAAGQVTTAQAMGDALLTRLQRAGIAFRVLEPAQA